MEDWLVDKFNLDLSLVARLGGTSVLRDSVQRRYVQVGNRIEWGWRAIDQQHCCCTWYEDNYCLAECCRLEPCDPTKRSAPLHHRVKRHLTLKPELHQTEQRFSQRDRNGFRAKSLGFGNLGHKLLRRCPDRITPGILSCVPTYKCETAHE